MPTPVGHAMAGVAVGLLVAGSPRDPRWSRYGRMLNELPLRKAIVVFFSLGVLADIDFLFGAHSMYTHSVGAAMLIGVLAVVMARGLGMRFALASASAYGSHVLLDWLGSDSVEPLGVMALWPFSERFFLSDRFWFYPVCRQYQNLDCWLGNLEGVLWEIAIFGPIIGGILYLRSINRRRQYFRW